MAPAVGEKSYVANGKQGCTCGRGGCLRPWHSKLGCRQGAPACPGLHHWQHSPLTSDSALPICPLGTEGGGRCPSAHTSAAQEGDCRPPCTPSPQSQPASSLFYDGVPCVQRRHSHRASRGGNPVSDGGFPPAARDAVLPAVSARLRLKSSWGFPVWNTVLRYRGLGNISGHSHFVFL